MRRVSDIRSNLNEQIEYAVQHIGREGSHKFRVFEAVYFHKSKSKSINYIIERTGLSKIAVQKAASALISKSLISQTRENGEQTYHVDESIWGHKNQILDLVKNPTKARALPTKRKPNTVLVERSVRTITKRELQKKKTLKVLFLIAGSEKGSELRVDLEALRVQKAIRASKFRENIQIEIITAADIDALVDGLNDCSPDIVHFSGHSNSSAISMDDGKVVNPQGTEISYSLLAKILAAVDDSPSLVIMNSCKSSGGMSKLLKSVDALITMNASISDLAASTFSPRFFAALAAGQSLSSAFEQGRNAIEAISLGEEDIVELNYNPGFEPKNFKLT